MQSAAVYLFVFLTRVRLRNQSQSAEAALAGNCVVSVSHISGVATADVKKKKVRQNRMKSAAVPRHRQRKEKKKCAHKVTRRRDALIILSRFLLPDSD